MRELTPMALKLQIRDDEIKARNNVAETYTRLLSDHFKDPIQKTENRKQNTRAKRAKPENRKHRTSCDITSPPGPNTPSRSKTATNYNQH